MNHIDILGIRVTCKYNADLAIKYKRRPKISAYSKAFFEYKRMRLFLSVYSSLCCFVVWEKAGSLAFPHIQD